MKFVAAWVGVALGIGSAMMSTDAQGQQDSAGQVEKRVAPVDSVDLDRYAGRWYEVARFPNSFQEDCTGETVAEYERLSNGQIRVVNSCRHSDGAQFTMHIGS